MTNWLAQTSPTPAFVKNEGASESTEIAQGQTNSSAVIEVENIYYRYPKYQHEVIKNLSFTIKKNERKAIIGKSGSGKSTLLKLIASLIKPNQGKIINRSEVLGYMFQSAHLFPWLTVYENATMGLKFLKKPINPNKVLSVLEWLGISEYSKRSISNLSGGQQQRVALARTILTEPDLLLLDEPFASLDPETTAVLQKDILEYCNSNQVGLLLVTHNYQEAIALGDKILKLETPTNEGDTKLNVISKELLMPYSI